jgi:uncharacterized membrane protein
MLGLTPLGIVHTAISLVAVVSGFWALARDKEINPNTVLGQVYLATTLVTAATGLGIFQHGGFGPPHTLALLTFLALLVGTLAAVTDLFGRLSRYVQAASYSATILFHMIPGVTESLTRLPPSAPILPSADAPAFKPIYGVLVLLFLVGLVFQLRWLRTQADGARLQAGAD